ncbi:hypothetical protein PGB90_001945 [Kerria lacca]
MFRNSKNRKIHPKKKIIPKRKESKNSTQSESSSSEKITKKVKKSTPNVLQKREGKSKTKNLVDIFNEHAIKNAYYTCHNVQDLLKIRGFPWPELMKKKKKNKK